MRTDTSTTPEPAVPDPATAAAAATEAILANMADRRHRAVVVDSPTGAGKSTLVVRAAQELTEGGEDPLVSGTA